MGTPVNLYNKISPKFRIKCVTNKPNLNLLLGHNRYATQGDILEETSHPFEFENIIGAHNGTVYQYSLKNFHGFSNYNIDSQIIFSHLNNTMDINKVWKDAEGAMALVWWDKQNKTLNLIRNKERTLFFTYTKDYKNLIYASEYWMITVGALRNGVEIEEIKKVEDTDILYTFSQEGGKIVLVTTSVTPFQKTFSPQQHGKNNLWVYSEGWDDWQNPSKDWQKNKKTTNIQMEENKKNCPPKLFPSTPLFVKQFIDNPKDCMCFFESDGGWETVIYIHESVYEDAKNKIIGRGKKGHYLCKELKKCSIKDVDFYGIWKDLTWIREEKKLSTLELVVNNEEAPWFDPAFTLTKKAWEEKTDCGCLNCSLKPVWLQRKDLKWVNKEVFICGKCSNDPYVEDLLKDYYGTRG
ncbi:MAG: class II glutamine amidotransferase [Fusobacteriaceae bacterium]